MLKRIVISVFLALQVLLVCPKIYAADLPENTGEMDREELEGVVLGLGALCSTQPYIDKDEDVYPVPIIYGRYKDLYSDGKALGYIFKENKNFEFSAVVKPRFMGYDSEDSPDLGGMDDRDWSVDAGLRGVCKSRYLSLELTGLADILSEHHGQEVSAVFFREFFEGLITPRAGVKWQSTELVDYYYGVQRSEARAGRNAYEAGSAVNFLAGINLSVPLGERWVGIVEFEYETLDSKIKDSPIVDTEEILTFLAGAAYRF